MSPLLSHPLSTRSPLSEARPILTRSSWSTVRSLKPQPSSAFRLGRALNEAIAGPGGDVVIRSGDAVGRIYTHGGSIVWARLSTEPGSLRDFLAASNEGIPAERLQMLVDEARHQRKSLIEMLVEHGLVERDALRERAAAWIRHRIQIMTKMKNAEVVFIPEARRYSGDLAFSPAEVVPAGLWQSVGRAQSRRPPPIEPDERRAPPPAPANVDDCLAEAMKIDGARRAAWYDAHTGHCYGARGEPIDVAFIRPQLKAIAALCAGGAVEDVVISAASAFHILRAVGASTRHFLYLELPRAGVTVALARHRLALVAAHAASDDVSVASSPPTVKSSGP